MRAVWLAVFASALAGCGGAISQKSEAVGGAETDAAGSPPVSMDTDASHPSASQSAVDAAIALADVGQPWTASPPIPMEGGTLPAPFDATNRSLDAAPTSDSPPDAPTSDSPPDAPPSLPPPDAAPLAPVRCEPLGHFDAVAGGRAVFALGESRDGLSMVTGIEGSMPNVQVLGALDGRRLTTIAGHGSVTYSATFSPNGELIATGGIEPGNSHPLDSLGTDTAKLWDAKSGQLVRTLPATCGFYVVSVEFSHEGSLLATSGAMGPIELWRVADGARVLGIPYSSTVYAARFSPDDTLLATAGIDRVATIWRVANGEKVRELRGHEGEVSDAVFSPDGAEIATSSYDKSIIVWDAAGAPLSRLNGHQMYISHVAWVDRDHLVSNDWGGIVKLWARGSDGRFAETATCTWNARSQSLGLAVSPDRTRLSATGTGPNDAPGVWTWPL